MSSPVIKVRHRTRGSNVAPIGDVRSSGGAALENRERLDAVASTVSQKADPRSYTVGYKRPPIPTQFKKGQSGNPNGRPKGAKNVATLTMELMRTRCPVRVDGKQITLSRTEIVLQHQAKKAMAGELKSAQFILGLLTAKEARSASQTEVLSYDPEAKSVGLEAEMLAHYYDQILTGRGFNQQQIDETLNAFGLSKQENGR